MNDYMSLPLKMFLNFHVSLGNGVIARQLMHPKVSDLLFTMR